MRSLLVSVIVAAFLAMVAATLVVGVMYGGMGSTGNSQNYRDANRSGGVSPSAGVMDAPVDESIYADFFIPEFDLRDQDGLEIDESILDGRVTVVDFFFTDCPLACPPMNAQMQRVQEGTSGTPVRLLSISVSGTRDTPDVLTEYAAKLAADPARWRFLTGDEAYVAGLVRDGLKFEVARDDSFEIQIGDGASMFNIQHPTRLLLIGPDRHVIDMADYLSPEAVGRLIERARAEATP